MGKNIKKLVPAVLILALLAFGTLRLLKNRTSVLKTGPAQSELDIVYGADSALITVFVYSSYNCAFCRRFFEETFPRFEQEYIQSAKVKLVLKLVDFSNEEQVVNALKTAVCINQYGNFSKLNQLLLTAPDVVYTHEFDEVVRGFIDQDINVAECMLGGEAEAYLKQNKMDFALYGFTGTPTFVIQKKVYKGFMDYEEISAIIEKGQ